MPQPTENAVLRILLPFPAVFAACTPLPQYVVLYNVAPVPENTARVSSSALFEDRASLAPSPAQQTAGRGEQAMQGPSPDAVSAAENSAPAMPEDQPAEALGRRTLSTAFVMVGPDGHLTIELRSGLVLVLRDIVMRPKEYCGSQVRGGLPGKRYCGGYASVTAARPGGHVD